MTDQSDARREPAAPTGAASLPLRTRMLYASAGLGGEALTASRGAWLVFYYAPPDDADLDSLLPIGVVGVLLSVASLLGALYDPLVGYWSDRTQTRWGRRLPFIVTSTPLWALAAFLLFTPPENAGVALTAAYLFLMLELFFFLSTLSGGPYEALLPELARTNQDRLSIVGIRVYFGAAGGAVGLVGSGLLVDAFGFQAMALAMALIALTFRMLGTFGVWSRAKSTVPPARVRLGESLRLTFSNRSFLRFLPTFVLFQVGLVLLLGALPFYATAIIGTDSEGLWVAIMTATALGTTLAFVPLFLRLAHRTSKRNAYRVAMVGAVIAFPLLAFAGAAPGLATEVEVLAVMVLVGAPLSGVYLFPSAITADIVDDDTLRTGMRREASFFGAQNLVEKAATSLSPLLLAALLLLGDSTDDPLGVRLVGPVAGVVVLIGFLTFRGYDLPDEIPARADAMVASGAVQSGRKE